MKIERPSDVAGMPARDPHVELRRLSHQLESVFLNQLFQAMRQSVPHEGGEAGSGGEMFQAMFDEKIADAATNGSTRGLGEALYRQLARRLDAGNGGQP